MNPTNATPPTLPGQQGDKPGGVLPHTTQVGPRPPVPASWQDLNRMVRTFLDLFEADPAEAMSLHKFAQEKLEKIRQGK